jgi:surface carbohydrate biosynthesis protein
MQDIDIAYLYEHASRELDVACAVTARLRKEQGLSVEILHWPHDFAEAVATLRPRLVVLPFCYSERSYLNLLHFWYEVPFFNLTWEQLLYPGNEKAKTPRGEFAIQHVVHHAWSRPYADLLSAQGVPADHIVLNGQPAYQLYDQPYCRFFETRKTLAKRHGLDPGRRWIFFPENYNWAFYSEAMLTRFLADGQTLDDVTEMRDFCNRSLREVLRWCHKAASNGKVEIILRPRPSTTLERFRETVTQVLPEIPTRLRIIQDESVREWILASDAVVSSHSTSLIEAAVAGKSLRILEPFPMPAPLRAVWHQYVERISTEVGFLELCNGAAASRASTLESWARETLMSNGDSIQNLSTYLGKLARGEVARPTYYLKRDFLTPAKRMLPKSWWALHRQREGRSRPVSPVYVKDVLPRADMENLIARWESVLV